MWVGKLGGGHLLPHNSLWHHSCKEAGLTCLGSSYCNSLWTSETEILGVSCVHVQKKTIHACFIF